MLAPSGNPQGYPEGLGFRVGISRPEPCPHRFFAETYRTLRICLRIEAERLNPRRNSLDKVHVTQVVGHFSVERRLRVVVSSHIATAKHAYPTPSKNHDWVRNGLAGGCRWMAKQSHSQLRGNKVPQSIRSTIQPRATQILYLS